MKDVKGITLATSDILEDSGIVIGDWLVGAGQC